MAPTGGWFRRNPDEPIAPIASQTLEEVIGTWPDGEIPVRIGDYMARPHQKWEISAVPEAGGYLGGPYYKIVIDGTGRALAATAECEVTTVESFSGEDNQLWRIDQLPDGTFRIMPKEIPGCEEPYALVSVADSTPGLSKFDPDSDNSKWNLKFKQ